MKTVRIASLRLAAASLAAAGLAGSAGAQTTFSVEWESQTVVPGGISEGDLLTPAAGAPALGPLAPPVIVHTAGALGLPRYSACALGSGCGVEVDALSYGVDDLISKKAPGRFWFSVHRYATGLPTTAFHPDVFSEANVGEAAADLFIVWGSPPGL